MKDNIGILENEVIYLAVSKDDSDKAIQLLSDAAIPLNQFTNPVSIISFNDSIVSLERYKQDNNISLDDDVHDMVLDRLESKIFDNYNSTNQIILDDNYNDYSDLIECVINEVERELEDYE